MLELAQNIVFLFFFIEIHSPTSVITFLFFHHNILNNYMPK